MAADGAIRQPLPAFGLGHLIVVEPKLHQSAPRDRRRDAGNQSGELSQHEPGRHGDQRGERGIVAADLQITLLLQHFSRRRIGVEDAEPPALDASGDAGDDGVVDGSLSVEPAVQERHAGLDAAGVHPVHDLHLRAVGHTDQQVGVPGHLGDVGGRTDAHGDRLDLDSGIELTYPFGGKPQLFLADVAVPIEDLTVQVGDLHPVELDRANVAHSHGRHIEQQVGTEAAEAEDCDPSIPQARLQLVLVLPHRGVGAEEVDVSLPPAKLVLVQDPLSRMCPVQEETRIVKLPHRGLDGVDGQARVVMGQRDPHLLDRAGAVEQFQQAANLAARVFDLGHLTVAADPNELSSPV